MKKVLLSGLVALVILGAALAVLRFVGGPEDDWICSGGQWVRHGVPSAPMPQEPCPPSAPQAKTEEEPGPAIPEILPLEMNFFEIGSLVRDTPGLKPDVWHLTYERLGAPLSSVELVFNQDSACLIGGEARPCADLDLESGVRTRVEGYRLENVYVLVRNLIAPMP